ncbi:MAG: shikimate kinase [Bacillota bacterium]|nr:shikimate kinase [Bacillota bacterium]
MGSGKSTIAKEISKKLNVDYYDTDQMIENREGKTITEIFELYGENYFRKLEDDLVKEVSKCNNSIISTGGGIVLNPENIALLKENGLVIYLENSVDDIVSRLKEEFDNRPLIVKNDLHTKIDKLLKQRENLYKKNADFIIENKKIDTTIKKIVNFIT